MNISKEFYNNTIIPNFIKKKHVTNIMAVPKILKVVINMGFKPSIVTNKSIDDFVKELTLISGQKPIVTKAKQSIAGFKLRKGFIIGCKVTLRKQNMYNFLDKLVALVLPRIRDFKGLSSKSFDGSGNYSLGIKEHIIFPEIDYDKISSVKGLDICIVTNSKTNALCKLLLTEFKFPF